MIREVVSTILKTHPGICINVATAMPGWKLHLPYQSSVFADVYIINDHATAGAREQQQEADSCPDQNFV